MSLSQKHLQEIDRLIQKHDEQSSKEQQVNEIVSRNYDICLFNDVFANRFYRAMLMHKRGICRHPVSVRLSVRPSVRHVRELRQND